jgi:hypothetical protein
MPFDMMIVNIVPAVLAPGNIENKKNKPKLKELI